MDHCIGITYSFVLNYPWRWRFNRCNM